MSVSQRYSNSGAAGFWGCLIAVDRIRWIAVKAIMLTAILGVMVSAIAAKDDAGQFAPMKFQIPSQPLTAALQAYSKVTGVQLLYESGATAARVSPAIEGDYTRDAALRMLIAETDLVIRYTRANSVTLVPASSDPDAPPMAVFDQADLALDTLLIRRPPPSSDASQLRSYSGVIQTDIQHALRKEAKTRNGVYSAGIKLWIDGPRTIRRTELFRSSGDLERDDTIARLLDGLQVSQAPPANTPQPVMVMITVR